MNLLRIIILVDGNNKIGMGHVYRSLNLVKNLRKLGHKIIFLTKEPITKKIISKTYVCKLTRNLNNNETKKFLTKFAPDIAILDKLNETKTNLQTLRQFCSIIAIDYTGKHKELISYGINILYPKSGISKTSYSDLNFAILNEKFIQTKKKIIKKKVQSILVLQGGADTYCFTPKIINAIYELDSKIQISVVLGPSFKCWPKLNQVLKKIPKPIHVYHNAKNMAPIMKKADLAVTAAGNTLLELAHLGIPSLIVCAEKFEIETAKLLEQNGFGINIGFGGNLTSRKLHFHLIRIIRDYNLRKKMNRIGPKLVDGKGASRIDEIIQTQIIGN